MFYAEALREIPRQGHTANLEVECNRTPEVTEKIKNDSFKQRLRQFIGGKYRETSENFYLEIPIVINTRT
jgi:DNA-dependent RNA polymerase auxiliary subunit epsilon